MADEKTSSSRRLAVERARRLRKPQTPLEERLWRRLRAGQLCGFKFRRQHPLGQYIVDFCCVESRVVVEVDGDSHAEQVAYDEERTRFLAGQGFRVIRVTNRDVLHNLEGVLELILAECRKRRR